MAVLGSAGRGESLLAMDQDNAIVFERGDPGGAEDQCFAALGSHLADILNEVGVPYCKGGVMAKNAQWRGSVATWHSGSPDWIARSRPHDLLSVDIFFDLRGVHGELGLADAAVALALTPPKAKSSLRSCWWRPPARSSAGSDFSAAARAQGPHRSEARRTVRHRIDRARAAIRHHVLERATPARLRGVRGLRLGGESDLDRLIDAQAVFLELVLSQQLYDIHAGQPATNTVRYGGWRRPNAHA